MRFPHIARKCFKSSKGVSLNKTVVFEKNSVMLRDSSDIHIIFERICRNVYSREFHINFHNKQLSKQIGVDHVSVYTQCFLMEICHKLWLW